jgi:hypothetical protein
LLGIEKFSCVIRRAMLRATAALYAGECLQRNDIRNVLAGIYAEILVAHQRRNAAETPARSQDRGRAEEQMQVFGVRDQGKENEQGDRVDPPVHSARTCVFREPGVRCQICEHQCEDEQRNDARFNGDWT